VKRWRWLLLVVVAVLVLVGGGGVVVVTIWDREKCKQALFDPKAAVNTGPDGARGGAWGLTQITEKTARGYGYMGSMSALLDDPQLAASLSATIANAGNPATIEDLGAWWNAGRKRAADLPEGHVTATTYIPRLKAALDKLEG